MNPTVPSSTFVEQLSSNDILCKKLFCELLKNQSVASWAATAIQSEPGCQNSRRGQPIVGRKGQDSTQPADSTQAPPQLDQLTLSSVLQSLATAEKSRSDSGSDTTSEFSMASTSRSLDRSVSLPGGEPITGIRGMNMERYKTELCRQHQETGFCKYGAKCQFAHGHQELRVVSRHPKYKTEMCKTYHTTGLCPYGTRCHFIHDEEEMVRHQVAKQRSRASNPQRNVVSRHASLPIGGNRRRDSKTFNPAVGSFPDVCLGSVGDTPPSSISSSPAPSPTAFLYEERTQSLPLPSATAGFVAPPPGFHSPPATAPVSMSPVFNFNKEVTSLTPFTDPVPFSGPAVDPANSLAAGLQAAVSNNNLQNSAARDCFSDFYFMPSSPPTCAGSDSETDSNICESPMDISRNLRLPIFSQISKE